MPEDVFRIVITVAVCLACLAFIVQALVAIGILRVARALQKKTSPLVDHVETISTKVVPVVDKLGPVIDKAGPAIEAATRAIAAVQKTVDETRPRVAEISMEAAAIAKSTRRQVDRIGAMLGDAGEKARDRLEQIDRSVDNTVEHLEQAGETMKRAMMRPVREVNGLAAGFGAAMSTLVHGSRRPSVDHATQDEEMFI